MQTEGRLYFRYRHKESIGISVGYTRDFEKEGVQGTLLKMSIVYSSGLGCILTRKIKRH